MLDDCVPLLKLCSLFADTYDIEGVKLQELKAVSGFLVCYKIHSEEWDYGFL